MITEEKREPGESDRRGWGEGEVTSCPSTAQAAALHASKASTASQKICAAVTANVLGLHSITIVEAHVVLCTLLVLPDVVFLVLCAAVLRHAPDRYPPIQLFVVGRQNLHAGDGG